MFLSFEMTNVAGAVNAELLFVLPHLLTPSEVLSEFQKSENGFKTCTLQLFAAKFVISLKFQEKFNVHSLFFPPLVFWTVACSARLTSRS